MIQILLFLVAIGIIFSILHVIWKVLKTLGKWLLIVIGAIVFLAFWEITVPIAIVLLVIVGSVKLSHAIKCSLETAKEERRRKRLRIENRKWIEDHQATYTEQQMDELLYPLIENVWEQDANDEDHKFKGENIPYGRANAFLNYFQKNVYDEEPYYYSCFPSRDDGEFREYGVMITKNGIYVSAQRMPSSDNSYSVINESIVFGGLKDIKVLEHGIEGEFISKETYDTISHKVILPATMTDISAMERLCRGVINNRISTALFNNQIIDTATAEMNAEIAENNLDQHLKQDSLENIAAITTAGASMKNYSDTFAETTGRNKGKGTLNASQGAGYGAEYANRTFDRARLKNVVGEKKTGNGRQAKAGYDRIVNGQEIQTKYYKTAQESIGAAFEHKQAIYIRSDGTEKMMQIEVPREQYRDALAEMQKRIDRGEVPNVEPGENASTYVRKGYFTYVQANNVCKSGTIESLTVDAVSGAICTMGAAGISGILVFAQAVWEGKSSKDAIQASLSSGLKILSKGTLIYTLTMQLTRKEIVNPFVKEYTKDGILKGFAGVENPIYNQVYKVSENLAENIRNSNIAKSQMGEALGLNTVSGKTVVANAVTAAVVFGPDLCKALSGRISTDQFIKNSAVGAVALVGAELGQALIPIPIVGGMIGGGIGGFVMKNLMDGYVEDDAKKMFRILKEEFLDGVMQSGLTNEEFEQVAECTVSNPNLSTILEDMYASGEYREYAKVAIVEPAIIGVISKRRKITQEDYDTAVMNFIFQAA
jgi:hypothetical protein